MSKEEPDRTSVTETPQVRVSVVMPAYNTAAYIAEAIESVIAQTFSGWELIVVNDGSTDETVKTVTPFLRDKRITLLSKPNGGAASARNAGIRKAQADLIAFLDSDDYWLPRKLEKQLECFRTFPDIGVCGTGMVIIDPDSNVISLGTVPDFHGNPFPTILEHSLANMSTAMVRRDVIEKAGLFDETLGAAPEDYEFWLRIGKYAVFHILSKPLACYRKGHENTSQRYAEQRHQLTLDVILPRFMKEQDGEKYIKWHHLARMKACRHKYRADSALRWNERTYWLFRSFLAWPFYGEAWSAVPWLFFPPNFIRRVKRLLKRNRTAPHEQQGDSSDGES
ncbi:MAG: glycosyltransferase family 2 protein [Planctomycetaceae bacterium]|jgi:glycosyltransferase involved in cell wall biosynthesis|nr:glycosyltransferase family 2 protein [Planctomycetaceae bacterium]